MRISPINIQNHFNINRNGKNLNFKQISNNNLSFGNYSEDDDDYDDYDDSKSYSERINRDIERYREFKKWEKEKADHEAFMDWCDKYLNRN